MKKILVTGANGQLGQSIRAITGDHEQVVFTDIEDMDLTDSALVEPSFYMNRYYAVINCAAYTNVDKAESEPEKAFAINRDAVQNLVKVCNKYGTLLIHLSTDYIFDGKSYKPYTEEDNPNPQGVYARSKWEGEQIVAKESRNAIIIRTSWLYSEYGSNFVKTILRKSKEEESLGVVFDQVGSPTYAGDLAEAILEMLNAEQEGITIYNFSNEGVCSWFDIAKAVVNMSKSECHVEPILTVDYPLPAPRPFYSVLDKSKIKEEVGLVIPYWLDSLGKCMHNLMNQQNPE